MEQKKGRLFVVSGPSGVGKGTICRALVEEYPEVKLSVSATTRAPRKGEEEGVSYFFRTAEEFRKMVDDGRMLEYAEVYGNFYGTPLDEILRLNAEGRDIILEIEMDGAMQVRKKYPDAVFVFVLPPSPEVLLERIVGRGTESEESIRRRTASAISEIERIRDYDYFIVNDIIKESVENLSLIIRSSREPRGEDEDSRLSALRVHDNPCVDVEAMLETIKGRRKCYNNPSTN